MPYLVMKSVPKLTSGFTSSPDAANKTKPEPEMFLSQLVRYSRFLQIKLIAESEWNKILALYPPTTP
ncbi:hypothetical protein T06_5376 [Trichinella sp. T6]|nr:hypothetical protein T06_5376 [Trichinella sp. T6]